MKITKQRLEQIIREEIDAKYRIPAASRGSGHVRMRNSLLKRLGLGDELIHDDDDIFLSVSDSELDSIPDRLRREYGAKR